MLTFQSVHLLGFMNITDRKLVKLDKPGLSLVIGKNGSGKSTQYTEGLFWCLFGKTIRADVSTDEVINKNSKTCEVQVTILDSESNETYRVTRKKARGSAVVLDLDRYTLATGSDLMLPSANLAEKQAKLEEWLGLDANTFLNSVIFGQGAAAMFASGIMSDSERKQIFDKICDLEEFDLALTVAKARLADSSTNHTVIGSRVMTHITLSAKAEEDKNAAELAYRETTKAFLTESKNLTKDIADVDGLISSNQKEQDLFAKEIAALESDLVAGPESEEVKEFKSVLESAKEYLTTSSVDTLNQINRKLGKVSGNYRLKLDEIKRYNNSICPTCGGPMPVVTKPDMITRLAREADVLKQEIEALEKELKEMYDTRLEIEGLKSGAEAELAKHEASKIETKHKLELLITQKSGLVKALSRLRDSQEVLTGMLTAAKNRMNKADSDLQKTVDRFLESNKLLVQHQAELKVASKKLAISKYWVEAFGSKGIKAYVIENVLPLLNTKLAEHLAELSDGDITAEIKSTTALKKGGAAERLSVTVQNSNGAEVYGGNSGGERRRIDLAILLALQDVVSARAKKGINLAVFDEILDALDEAGISRAVDYLKVRSVEKPTYLISHTDAVKSLVENVERL